MTQRTQYPEWFIGGPLEGKDRLIEYPHFTGHCLRVPWTPPIKPEDLLKDDEGLWVEPLWFNYNRTPFAIGDVTLTVWLMSDLDQRFAATTLAKIMLKPHERTEATTS